MIRKILNILFIFIAISISGCAWENSKGLTMNSESIGTAHMNADGTIVLSLRAESPNGKDVGETQFEYKATDPYYSKILEHIGGIQKGETKLVPPWPDQVKAQNEN